jgi:hypothetical protein
MGVTHKRVRSRRFSKRDNDVGLAKNPVLGDAAEKTVCSDVATRNTPPPPVTGGSTWNSARGTVDEPVSVSGSVSGGAPSISFSASTSNASAATTYTIYRSTWRAETGSYIDNDNLVATTTSTSFTDDSSYISLNSYHGTTYPGLCDYSWVSYRIHAYNNGVSSDQWVWFLGAFNPDGCVG